jgi:LysM repeat protein
MAKNGAASPAAPVTSSVSGGTKMITYKVRAGENMGDIAGRYNTSVRDIATLNRISPTTKLRAGQVIKVPVRGK